MENQPGRSVEAHEPRVTIAIMRSAEDLALYQRAAKLAGGTAIEVLPNDPTTVDTYIAHSNPSIQPVVDFAAYARKALESGATIVRVTEDMEVRRKTPGDVWNYHMSLQERSLK